MTKDPAFLFYYADFQHGTRRMTFEEKGAYIELLCEQADSGHLSLKEIQRVLKDSFPIWESICCKFIEDKDGLYYNSTLEGHMIKRKAFVKSRINNLHKDDHKGSHMNEHMENGNRNGNKDVNKRFNKPKIQEIVDYCIERNNQVDPEKFFDFYESKGWLVGKNKMKDWKACVRTWEKPNKPVYEKPVTAGRGFGTYKHFDEV